MGSMFELPDDHPGVHDHAYRRRRAIIAEQGAAWAPGRPIPVVDYTADEHALWSRVLGELRAKHARYCCQEFQRGAARLDLPTNHLPQLRDLDAQLRDLSGFRVEPVPGLVPARHFYGKLADRTFLSTQYIRHTSVPFYTPEPDIVHEVAGHLNMLANPAFADLHQLAGEASRRCGSDAAHEFFSRVFWFTLEFGVVWEDGEVKVYGAGLASSYGEIEEYHTAEIRPLDIVAMGMLDYDITRYQPVLFAAPSFDEMVDVVGDFFSRFDDDEHARLLASGVSPASS